MYTIEYTLSEEEKNITEKVFLDTKKEKAEKSLSPREASQYYAKKIDELLELEIFTHLGFSITGEITYKTKNKEIANNISILKATVNHTLKIAA